MEKVNVIIRKNVTDYLEELVFILYENEYFGFESDAQDYVQKIYDFIEYNLPIFPFRKTPENLIERVQNTFFTKLIERQLGMFSLKM